MKKIVSLLLTVITVITLSLTVSADMGPPMFISYEVYVTNPNGTEIYKYSYDAVEEIYELAKTGNKFEYNEKLTVVSDTLIENGVEYSAVEINGEWLYIERKDIAPVLDSVSPEGCEKLPEPSTFVVIDEGFYLFKGPAFAYDKIGKEIPVGTEITFEYYMSADGSAWEQTWVYVEYEKEKGWAYIYQYGMSYLTASKINPNSRFSLYDYDGELYVVEDGMRLLEKPVDAEILRGKFDDDYYLNEEISRFKEVSREIPKDTRLKFEYYYKTANAVFYYTEYKGKKGWAYEEDICSIHPVVAAVPGACYLLNDVALYEKVGDKTSRVLGERKKDTFNKVRFVAFIDDVAWMGMDVGTKIGWFEIKGNILGEPYYHEGFNELHFCVTTDETVLYEDPELTKPIQTLPIKSTLINLLGYGYVEFNGTRGFVDSKDLDFLETEGLYTYSYEDYWNGVPVDDKETERAIKKLFASLEENEGTTETEYTTELEKTTKYHEELSYEETSVALEYEAVEENKPSSRRTVVYCISSAVVLALTATVTIILVNKKRKKEQ